jgi:NAD(P)-dependent dehydrogenase (short-subunit alcohol dehydrogenase family)
MWNKDNIPDLTGKTAIVTGGNSGIGYEMAKNLAHSGAHVIIAGRDSSRIAEAATSINAERGGGKVSSMVLNLASLEQIKQFARGFVSRHSQLDILINNAGIMMPPQSLTEDGYELQFGTNFLGHFALVANLFNIITSTPKARVVTLSSGAYKWATVIDYQNLRLEKPYDPMREYGVSKLADLLFALHLQRKFIKMGSTARSCEAHPGIVRTALQRHLEPTVLNAYENIMEPWQGALPALYAAISKDLGDEGYYGPDGYRELTGYPGPAFINDIAADERFAEELWKYTALQTGYKF